MLSCLSEGGRPLGTPHFVEQIQKLQKKHSYAYSPAYEQDVRALFLRLLGGDKQIGRELFDHVLKEGRIGEEEILRLGDMVDLFTQDYDRNISSLGPEDWEFIKDLVNAWAAEMDLELVTSIMQEVLNEGLL